MSSFTVDVGRFLTDIQRRWDRLGPAERMRLLKGAGLLVMGAPMTLTGSAHFLAGHGAHMQAVQHALQESIPLTTQLLKQQLADFELDSLWPLLQKFAIEAGSYIGGGAVLGAAVGSAPGALVGAKVGAWVYQAVGVAELVIDLPDLCSQVAGPYCSGFNSAWALGEPALRDPIQQSLHRAKAAREFATGHALLVTALLATLALYLGRNAARRTPLFTALANGRLGKNFAKWIERHQAQMIQSPKLKPRKTLAQQVQEEEARLLARAKAEQPRHAVEKKKESADSEGAEAASEKGLGSDRTTSAKVRGGKTNGGASTNNPSGTVFSGHGGYEIGSGIAVVPEGTTLTVYSKFGSTITDRLGNVVETGGDVSKVYSRTYQPGERLPNYTLHPPEGLNIRGGPFTVSAPTRVSELLKPNMGECKWAACTYNWRASGANTVYDTVGIGDKKIKKWIKVY